MRGKHSSRMRRISLAGNIPAYAGKTCYSPWLKCWKKEHPRVCGENAGHLWSCFWPVGTSPRMRGKPGLEDRGALPRRNIPAYAGKTIMPESPKDIAAEHPRVCGENYLAGISQHSQRGTSPRMRGKHDQLRSPKRRARNIPAYAGKTSSASAIRFAI